ncbi:MAG: leucine-rich repeat protein, partial [Lachnospiraceae bacterium]|nr:leucine-rich repeat protein [Lachnospiraceae bacterium]
TKEKILQNKKKLLICGGVLAVLLVVLIALAAGSGGSKFEKLIDLGNRYLEEMEYEEAIATFDSAIAIEPRDERGYIGKATAEYRLGWLDDAIETLTTGIEMVEDSTNLQAMLDEIRKEMQENEDSVTDSEAEMPDDDAEDNYAAGLNTERPLWLNYAKVQLYDAKVFQIQLDVVGDEGNGSRYTWTSNNEDRATVTADGLVTVNSVEDDLGDTSSPGFYKYYSVSITVQDSSGKSDTCQIERVLTESDSDRGPDYTIRVVPDEDAETDDESPVSVLIEEDEDSSSATLDGLDEFVYYSGDVVIPGQLTYQGTVYSVTSIMEKAFKYSTELTSLTIPASVTSIDGSEQSNPFVFCSQLRTITVAEDSESYQTIDGVLYSKDGKILIAYPAQKEGETFEIPKEVEQIAAGALSGCIYLKEITVEEGNECFEAVDGVLIDSQTKTLLAYPSGKEDSYYETLEGVKTIASRAFYNVHAEEIHVGSEVTALKEGAFYKCTKLTTLSGMEQVADITTDAIVSCDNLKKVGGGEGTTQIWLLYQGEIELLNPSELTNLTSLALDIADGSDLSWLLGMDNLRKLDLRLSTITDLDLDTLYQMDGLRVLDIQTDENTTGSVSEEQQEEIQEFIDSRTDWQSVFILGVRN